MSVPDIVVGCQPDERGDDAVALAGLLARFLGAGIVLAHVVPGPFPGTRVGRVDAEWQAFQRLEAADILDGAERRLARVVPGIEARRVVTAHRGSGSGLAEAAGREGASMVVIGSAPGGHADRVELGSTADQLLHGSPVPVAIAPEGFAARVPERLTRCTLAYHRSERSTAPGATLDCGVALARRLGASVRLLTVIAHPRRLYSGRQHHPVEQQVLAVARRQLLEDLDDAAGRLPPDLTVERRLAEGRDVRAALDAVDWEDELLVCAASEVGPLSRVFVGDIALKLVRAAHTPVVVFPRGATLAGWT